MGQPSERILIVDDDSEVRDLLVVLLGLEGYQVEQAENGLSALRVLRRLQAGGTLPHLILLDLSMPGMNGPEFLLAQRKDPDLSGIPVVLISGELDGLDQALALGADGFLRKPAGRDKILAAIRRYGRDPGPCRSITRLY